MRAIYDFSPSSEEEIPLEVGQVRQEKLLFFAWGRQPI